MIPFIFVLEIGLEIDRAQAYFFDREALQDQAARASLDALARFGAFVRRRAIGLIHQRDAASKPGQPPSSHTGDIKKIYFGLEPETQNVVIGPVLLGDKPGDAPEALERGGRSTVVRRKTRRRGTNSAPRTIHIEPRPFMGPAFAAEMPKAAGLWENSIN